MMTYVNREIRDMASDDAGDFGDLLYSTYGDVLTCKMVNDIADLAGEFFMQCMQRAYDLGHDHAVDAGDDTW